LDADAGTLQGKPWGLAVDGSNVYWADSYFGQVLKASK
jgi:hypothetical protein